MLQEFISKYSLEDIIRIETQEEQYQAIKQAWDSGLFSPEMLGYLVLQCALVGYQVAGSGPQWWQEWSERIINEAATLNTLSYHNSSWWHGFMTTSKYNKRLYNLKTKRLQRFEMFGEQIEKKLSHFTDHIDELHQEIAHIMSQKENNKTICFASKMFGYAIRCINDSYIPYPESIAIPLDSRLIQMYAYEKGIHHHDVEPSQALDFFAEIAIQNKIAPLHVDSILWLDFWRLHHSEILEHRKVQKK